jgi:cytidine deaminase
LPVAERHIHPGIGKPDPITVGALRAAEMSYAPYTRAYAGVAIRTTTGKLYLGSYIENAAYNPSLSPLQVALTQLTLAGEEPTHVVEAVLAETANRKISHRVTTDAVLHAVAPSATLRTVAVSE